MPSTQKRPRAPSRPTSRRPPRSQRPRTEPPDTLRNFADLVGANSSRADAALGEDAPDDAWAAISNTIGNLASQPPSLLPAPEALSADDVLNYGDTEYEHLPYDLSVKTKLSVLSTRDLWWTSVRGQGEEYAALQAYLCGESDEGPPRGSEARDAPSPQLLAARRRFYKSLLHFRHPYAPLPASISSRWQALFSTAGITRLTELRDVGRQRVSLWHDALRSLYYGYKYGHVNNFYVILSTTTVLFTRHPPTHSDSTNPPLRAVFARASAGLRALLSEYMVSFQLEDAAADDPCLVVDDDVGVQGAYNFVFAAGPKLSNASDVPVLLCDSPFRGGTPVAASVSKARQAKVGGDDTRKTFSMHISGFLLPKQVRAICHAFATTQQGDFGVRIETETSGNRLNISGHGEETIVSGVQNGTEGVELLRGAKVLSKVSMKPDGENFIVVARDVD